MSRILKRTKNRNMANSKRSSNAICIEDNPKNFEYIQGLLERHALSGRCGLATAFCQKRKKEVRGIFVLIQDISALTKEKDSEGLPDISAYIKFLES